MPHYIKNGRIVEFVNAIGGGTKLNDEQVDFYIDNPTATISEILNTQLNPSLDKLKQEKFQDLTNSRNFYLGTNPISQTYNSGSDTLYIVPTEEISQNLVADLTGINSRKSIGENITNIEVYDNSDNEHTLTISELESLVAKIHILSRRIHINEKSYTKQINQATSSIGLDNINFDWGV